MNQDSSISGDGNNDIHDNVSNVNEEIGNSNFINDDVNAEKDSNTNTNDNDNDAVNQDLSDMSINSRSKKKKGTCLYCLQVVKGSMRCTRCETALYCGRECQLKHWPVHKNICQDSNDTEDIDKKLERKADNHLNQGNCMSYILKDYHY